MEITKTMIKNFNQLATIVELRELSYNPRNKQEFKVVGTRVMKELAKLLDLKESRVSFNPGGIAVSGDLSLMGMWEEGRGIYVHISGKGITETIMYRTIKHMKDFSGGHNRWMKSDTLLDLPRFVEILKNVS